MKNILTVGCTALLCTVLGYGQAAGTQRQNSVAAPVASAASATPAARASQATAQRVAATGPALADYEGMRDWLENEIDRKAIARGINPGSVVLHRLNRTEYANVIHELLDLEVDPAKYLPPDDSARGFDNVAGSLTISPTLLEAYTTAATRIAGMAVGYWKAPTEVSYIVAGDVGQTDHIEGLPLGTCGGMLVRHNFPA